ncbi:MAG: DNRLRE domain-containing protein [Actinomycetota bacterium]
MIVLVALFSLLSVAPAAAETVSLNPSADVPVISIHPNTQYDDYPMLYLFHTPEGERHSFFIHFDLSSVPVGSTIDSATLRLYVLGRDASNLMIPVYRCTEPWPTPLTYNNQPSVSSSPVVETAFTAATASWQTFDLTGLVQGWVNAEYPNNGIKVGLPRFMKNTVRFMWTLPSSDNEGSDIWPALVVNYTIPAAPESETGITSPSTSETPAGSTEPTPTSSAQATGSQITKVKADRIKTSSAYITWTTDADSNSYVEYGETTAYGKTSGKDDKLKTHSVQLIELKTDKTYHFRVKSTNADGHQVVSKDYTFRTVKEIIPAETKKPEEKSHVLFWVAIGVLSLLVLILAGILVFLYIRNRNKS